MELILDCYPCIMRQVLSMAKLAGLDSGQKKQVMDYSLTTLLSVSEVTSPQHVIVGVTDYIRNTFFPDVDVFDPYKELKDESNRCVLSSFTAVEAMIQAASSPLETAIKCAAAGNIIDFGAMDHAAVDIGREIAAIPTLMFARYDFQAFSEELARAARVLYIGDNAGEIVFDRLCIRQLRRCCPEVHIVFATRSEPVINDATLADAKAVGLEDEATVISSGCRYPGLMLSDAGDELKNEWKHADLIIAKGQGNYEGLSEISDGRLFFILRVKCQRVADDIGAKVGELVLWRRTGSTATGR